MIFGTRSGPGSAVLLVPGGASESLLAAPGTCKLVMRPSIKMKEEHNYICLFVAADFQEERVRQAGH